MRSPTLPLIFILGASATTLNAAPITYNALYLGAYAPTGINASGQISANAIGNGLSGVRITGDNVDVLPGDGATTAINDSGVIGGNYGLTATAAYATTGWTPVTSTQSSAYGINNSGALAGFMTVPGTPNNFAHAFVWDGTMRDLGTLSGNWSRAYGINDSGQVTGGAEVVVDVTLGGYVYSSHAMFYDGSTMHDLGTLADSFALSEGRAINASGQITGYSTNADGAFRAFLYSGGGMTDLGHLGGGESFGVAINSAGHVVGSSSTSSAQSAFLYRDGVMFDLNNLVVTGLEPGDHLSYASGINASGMIVALGTAGGYLLTPEVSEAPEPSTWLIAAFYLGLLAPGRRRYSNSTSRSTSSGEL